MNYSELTDFEVNKLVAEALGHQIEGDHIKQPIPSSSVFADNQLDSISFRLAPIPDYCNKIVCVWPIILDNKISLEHRHPGYRFAGCWDASISVPNSAGNDWVQYRAIDKNPLKAAMLAYLELQEDKQ